MNWSRETIGKWFTRRARTGYLLGILIFVVASAFALASQENWITAVVAPVFVVAFVAVGYFIALRIGRRQDP